LFPYTTLFRSIAENTERRGEAEKDPIKKSRIAKYLQEYWGVRNGINQHRVGQNVQPKTTADIAETIGESVKTTQRLLKLHDLIPQLQRLVSAGKLGTTADFLRRKESNIDRAVGDMVYTVGGELKEAQEVLASHDKYSGVFEKWYTYKGFAKRTVYDYIAYHDVVRQAHEIGS